MSSEFMTEKQVAKILHVAPITMWRWRKQGFAPPYMQLGRRVLYKFDDVLEWCEGLTSYAPVDSGRASQAVRYERRTA